MDDPSYETDWDRMTQSQKTLAVIDKLWDYVSSEFQTSATDWPKPGTPLRLLADRTDEVEGMLKT